jgi:hypothetical protein
VPDLTSIAASFSRAATLAGAFSCAKSGIREMKRKIRIDLIKWLWLSWHGAWLQNWIWQSSIE